MRSLPEHTVDCWVSAAVLAQYPEALLWAPTQRGSDNWDIAFESLGGGKAIILEDKGTEAMPSGQHAITIDLEQLNDYLGSVGAPVYYVLPVPPWPAFESAVVLSTGSPVPAAARCRTAASCGHRHGPFSEWCRVVAAEALRDWLRGGRYGTRTFRASDIIAYPLAVTLGEFLKGLGVCTQGGPWYESAADARDGWIAELRQRQDQVAVSRAEQRIGASALGVFVPLSRPAPLARAAF
jgi:hypothetical protein